MVKKTETKITTIEREYIIPLREKSRVVPRYKKTPKAVKTIREFLVRHMKIYDGDLRKIKIDSYLNEYLWFRGIRKHPHKIKVKATKEIVDGKEFVRVELVDYPTDLKFKKLRAERFDKKSEEAGKKKKDKKEEPKTEKKEEKEKKEEEKENKSAVVEAGGEFEKAAAKQAKHATIEAGRIKQMTKQRHQMRKALAK